MMRSLLQRRVPQIVGLYIGATWMMIEIGDWVTDRFQLPPNLTSYIFVGMLALIPAVAVVAWFHGAPGKDEWTRVEKAIVPLNIVLAFFAVAYFVGPLQPVSATEIKQVIDETGAVQNFEVPKAGFNRKITVFFFDNKTGDAGLDWLSYGLAMMLAHDLNNQSPLISAATPFDSNYLKEELRSKGFAEARNAPRSLQIQIAHGRLSDVLINGVIEKRDGRPQVVARLVDVQTGKELANAEGDQDDWMQLVDKLSLKFRDKMGLGDESEGENNPLSENLSNSINAVKLYVEAQREAQLFNNFPAALQALNSAVDIDPSFAEANSLKGTLQYLSGASQDALITIEKAFAHDYRLSLASKFKLRALRYQFEGKNEAALRVLQMWTEVQSQNPEAFRELGRLLLLQGARQDEALAAFARVLELNPSAHDAYLQQATVEQTRGNFDAAAVLAKKFIALRRDDVDAHLLLARINVAAGQLSAAREAYMNAEILAAGSLAPEVGLARLDIRSGQFDAAQARIDALLARELTPTQQVEAMNVVFELQYMQGKLRDTLTTLYRMDEIAQAFLPPILRIIQIGSTVANSKTLLGDFDGARAEIARMAEQMQPPFDNYLAFATLGIEAEAGNKDAFLAALAEAEAFYEVSQNETLAPFVLWARAYGDWLEGDQQGAIDNSMAALESYEQSFISSLSEAASSVEIKIEMYKLLIRLGRLDDARTGLQEIIAAAPALATARQVMAMLALERGDTAVARTQLEAALKIWKDADADYLRYAEARQQIEGLDATILDAASR